MKVVKLSSRRNAADPEMVKVCERLLKWAKSGSLKGLGYATVRPAGIVGTAWHINEKDRCSHELLSGVSQLSYRLNQAMHELPDAGESEDDAG